MTCASLIKTFTHDGEIKEWIPDDDSVELRGYVDQIEGIKSVVSRGSKKTEIFKIVVNNGGKSRVRVLFWGSDATKYSSLIHDRTIITITRGKTQTPNPRFANPNEVVAALELAVLSPTDVEIDAKTFEETVDVLKIPTVKLKDAVDTVGPMFVTACIKQPFRLVTSYSVSYGGGVVVDGDYRLRVKIAKYDNSVTFPKGNFIRFRCQSFTDHHSIPGLTVRSMDDIEHLKDEIPVTAEELREKGFQTPKRKCATDGEENTKKSRSPFAD